jgi:hypothetical protein
MDKSTNLEILRVLIFFSTVSWPAMGPILTDIQTGLFQAKEPGQSPDSSYPPTDEVIVCAAIKSTPVIPHGAMINEVQGCALTPFPH